MFSDLGARSICSCRLYLLSKTLDEAAERERGIEREGEGERERGRERERERGGERELNSTSCAYKGGLTRNLGNIFRRIHCY